MEKVMHNAYGHLEGTVIEVEYFGPGHYLIAVKAANGVECYASDIYGDKRPFPIRVGMKILLEEATVMFDNGRIVYCIDENLRGVEVNGIDLGQFIRKRV
ncbi:MAG: hypothetical protein WAT81_04120 [Candidatus Moraniibacteriota bacterium]